MNKLSVHRHGHAYFFKGVGGTEEKKTSIQQYMWLKTLIKRFTFCNRIILQLEKEINYTVIDPQWSVVCNQLTWAVSLKLKWKNINSKLHNLWHVFGSVVKIINFEWIDFVRLIPVKS